MKYKACCERRCLLAGCEIELNGGCYCACRISDKISSLESIIQGRTIYNNGACVYISDSYSRDLHIKNMTKETKDAYLRFKNEEAQLILEKMKIKMKEYEISI